MSIYVIGDVQGCYSALRKLLDKIKFTPVKDKLWFVGDMVNRGPQSLEVLRFIKNLGNTAIAILGNHDLHLLCVAHGIQKKHASDTLHSILEADDCEELLNWLRFRPMIHQEFGYTMVHAGLLPQWTMEDALKYGQEVETALQQENYRDFLRFMYGNKPTSWTNNLVGYDRLRVITNALTRIRLVNKEGEMDFDFKGKVDQKPKNLFPWYEAPQRKTVNDPIIFGHWSALGLKIKSNILALDTGCLWGGCLTALRLEDREVFQVSCKEELSLQDFMKK